MNKKISLYSVGAIAELLLFFSGIALTGRNDLFWIIPAVSVVGMGVTVFLLCREYEALQNERSDKLNQNKRIEMDEFTRLFGELKSEVQAKSSNFEQMICSLSNTVHNNSESISQMGDILSDYQKKYENNITALTDIIEENSVKYKETTEAMCGDIKTGLSELRTIEAQQIQKLADEVAKSVSGLTDVLNANSEKMNSHVINGFEKLQNLTEAQHKSLVELSGATYSQMKDMLSEYQTEAENNITALTDIIEENNTSYQKTTEAMCGDIKTGLSELRTIEAQQHQKLADEVANSVSKLTDVLNANSEKMNSHVINGYKQLKNISEEQYKSLVKYSEEVSGKVNGLVDSLSAMPEIVEQTVSKNSEITADYINCAEQKYEKLTRSFSENVSAASGKAVSDAVSELCEIYEKTSHHIIEKTEQCFEKFDVSYKRALDSVAQKLYDENKTTNEQFIHNLSETETEHNDNLRKTFDEISLKHAEAVSTALSSGMDAVRNENKAIAERVEELISAENSFVGSAEEKLTGALDLIEKASSTYEDSFEKVNELVSDYTDSIKNTVGSQLKDIVTELNRCSTEITGRQTSELSKSMKTISVEFTDLSAKAIASVQDKNNEHICRIADSLTELSKSTAFLSDEWRKADKSIRGELSDMSASIKRSVNQQSETNAILVSDLHVAIDEKIARLDELVDKKIEDGAKALHSTISGYTMEFVNSNAQALASVQKDNLDKIKDAGDNVTRLAEVVLKFINNTNQFNRELHEMLAENAENQGETLTDFNADFQKKVNKLSQMLAEKTEEHNSESEKIQKQIQDITSNYERMFSQILENQKNMQAMTDSDINLLTKLLK